MTRIIARHVETLAADEAASFLFELTYMHQDLADLLMDRVRDVYVTIPNTVPIGAYHRYAIEEICNSFSDLWSGGNYVLPTDITIIGWKELQFVNRETMIYQDEMTGPSTTSGAIGQHGWTRLSSGGSIAAGNNAAGHPGIVTIETSPTQAEILVHPGQYALEFIQEWTGIIQTAGQSPGNLVGNCSISFGLVEASGACNLDFSRNGGDTWHLWNLYGAGSIDVRIDTGLQIRQGNWYELSLVRISDTQMRGRITNLTSRVVSTVDMTITLHSALRTMLFRPRVAISNNVSGILTGRWAHIDYSRLVLGGLKREI